jgi:zinc transport system substrate-binding protein
MKATRLRISLCIIISFIVLGRTAFASGEKMKVVASIPPLADFARQVGGDKVDVTLLLPPGASPHTFEPTPRAVQEISRAKIFVKVGAGLEFWADKLIAAVAPGITTVNCSEGVDLLRGYGHNDGNSSDHKHAGEMRGADPHFWLDPVICIGIVRKIEEAFSKTDPADAPYYRKNAAGYISKLKDLNNEIASAIGSFRTREYITFHPAWNYFSRRYGLQVAGVIEESPGRDPSPKQIGRILGLLRSMKTRIIFAEPQFSPKIAEAIAKQAGGRVLFLDPEGGQKGRETYIELMHYNLSVMEEAMK